MVSLRRLTISAGALLIFLAPIDGLATCGTGHPPSYDDIEAIMVTQNDQQAAMTTPLPFTVSTFARSSYWAFFWETGPARFPTVYSQFSLRGMVGTYHLSVRLADATGVLKQHDFFNLSPEEHLITDTPKLVLSVKRCAVITRIGMYNPPPDDEDGQTKALFEDLQHLVAGAKATKISDKPKAFEETLLFDP
jgi:hypothetical protein